MISTRFVRSSGIFLCLITLIFAAGCASRGGSNTATLSGRQIDVAMQNMKACLTSTPKGNKAQCASQLYTRLSSGLSDDDPGKAPSLTALTKMHRLFAKYDRGEITSSEDMQNDMRQITQELTLDLQRAEYYSAAQNEIESRRQRQLFQEAQRLLSPTTSNLRTCQPAPGYSPGTMVCQ
jgi:hypothetical protein